MALSGEPYRERGVIAVAGIARIIHSHNMQFCGDSVSPWPGKGTLFQ